MPRSRIIASLAVAPVVAASMSGCIAMPPGSNGLGPATPESALSSCTADEIRAIELGGGSAEEREALADLYVDVVDEAVQEASEDRLSIRMDSAATVGLMESTVACTLERLGGPADQVEAALHPTQSTILRWDGWEGAGTGSLDLEGFRKVTLSASDR